MLAEVSAKAAKVTLWQESAVGIAFQTGISSTWSADPEIKIYPHRWNRIEWFSGKTPHQFYFIKFVWHQHRKY